MPTNVPIKADFAFELFSFHDVRHRIIPMSGIRKLLT